MITGDHTAGVSGSIKLTPTFAERVTYETLCTTLRWLGNGHCRGREGSWNQQTEGNMGRWDRNPTTILIVSVLITTTINSMIKCGLNVG